MSLQCLLNDSRTLLVPSLSGLAVAGALERFTELTFEPSVGIWVECYRDHHQVLVFSGEDIEELWSLEHFCDRFVVEVFEVLEVELELPLIRFIVYTHIILIMLIDLRNSPFCWSNGDQSIGFEGISDRLPQ